MQSNQLVFQQLGLLRRKPHHLKWHFVGPLLVMSLSKPWTWVNVGDIVARQTTFGFEEVIHREGIVVAGLCNWWARCYVIAPILARPGSVKL